MTTGYLPFGAGNLSELSTKVMHRKYHIPYNLSKDIKSRICLVLMVKARQLPNVQDLLSHPWLQQGGKTLTFHSNRDNSFPDPDIMGAMECIEFLSQEIRESLHQNSSMNLWLHTTS